MHQSFTGAHRLITRVSNTSDGKKIVSAIEDRSVRISKLDGSGWRTEVLSDILDW